MKKIIHISIAVFIIALAGTSCKKDSSKPKTPTASNALVGYWFGTFSSANLGEVFKSDGTTVQYDFYGVATTDTASCPYKGYGTYTLTGNNVNLSVTFPTLSNQIINLTGILNTSVNPNAVKGSYSSPNGAESGNFAFFKQ